MSIEFLETGKGGGVWEEEPKVCKIIRNNQNYFSLILKTKTFREKLLGVRGLITNYFTLLWKYGTQIQMLRSS